MLHRNFYAIPSPSVYSFTCDFTTNGTVWQRQKLIKEFAQVFRYMSYDSFAVENCYGKFIVLVVYFVLYLNIVVTKFWIPNVHVSMITTNVRVQRTFKALVKKLSSDVSPDKYVDFERELATAEPGIKIDTLGWRQKSRAECIGSAINSAFRQVVISDESEDEVEVDKNERGPNLKRNFRIPRQNLSMPSIG